MSKLVLKKLDVSSVMEEVEGSEMRVLHKVYKLENYEDKSIDYSKERRKIIQKLKSEGTTIEEMMRKTHGKVNVKYLKMSVLVDHLCWLRGCREKIEDYANRKYDPLTWVVNFGYQHEEEALKNMIKEQTYIRKEIMRLVREHIKCAIVIRGLVRQLCET